MLQLNQDKLIFSFSDVHANAQMTIHFQRTLRIPDDGNTYPLPPGLGKFPVRLVDEFKAKVPPKWVEHGGVMLPLYQSEALWIRFEATIVPQQGSYPFAVKVSTGKRSAVTGRSWQDGLCEGDYVIVPKQPWLDGYVVKEGEVAQFVAVPLGMGFSVEELLTEKAEFGGIQLEVFPMKREVFERRFPKQEWEWEWDQKKEITRGIIRCQSLDIDMGLGAGGRMKQQVFKDEYGLNDWDINHKDRCFVHLCNTLGWRTITGHEPPPTPITSAEYTKHGYPWFSYYTEDSAVSASSELAGIKTVNQVGKDKGFGLLPENETVDIPVGQVKKLTPNQVRNGSW
jgi:hypothetical protein